MGCKRLGMILAGAALPPNAGSIVDWGAAGGGNLGIGEIHGEKD